MADRPSAGGGSRLLLLLFDSAMGFAPPRLMVAPAEAAGARARARVPARLPAGVHEVAGLAVATTAAAHYGDSTLPRASRLVLGPAAVGAAPPPLLAGCRAATGTTSSTNFLLVAPPFAGPRNALSSAVAAAAAAASGSSSSSAGRRGRRPVVVASAAGTGNSYPSELSEDDDDAETRGSVRPPPSRNDLRSASHIRAWLDLALLKITFEVAFDAGALESGRQLRRALDFIGEIDLTAPVSPWSGDVCHDRIKALVGTDKLNELLSASTPDDDVPFQWSALAAMSVIEPVQILMVILHARVMLNLPPAYNLPLRSSCPSFLRQFLGAFSEFSRIIETTKFCRPQNSIRYRMLEAHALALEHAHAIALDLHEEVCQEEPDQEWLDLRRQLRHRRITLFEQDVGLPDYMTTGVEDTGKVIEFVKKTCMLVSRIDSGAT